MGLIMGILVLAVFLYIGLGFEVGIQDTITANNLPTLEGDLILTIFVAIMIFGALHSMNDAT